MKKIMFNDKYGLTEAVLERRKTMTRRENKKLNHPLVADISDWGIDENGKAFVSITYSTGLNENVYPAYQPGEVVAIAQPYKQCWDIYQKQWESYNDPSSWRTPDAILGDSVQETAGWTNKMFVKAGYMPRHILITDLKFERLQDISDEDIMREGIFKYDKPPLYHECDPFAPWPPYVKPYKHDNDNLIYRCSARYAFAYLIDKVSGTGTWNRNPWVFAYEFELLW